MKLKMSIRGVEEWQAYLKQLPRGVMRVALYAIAEWIVGNGQRGLKRYPEYRYVSRKLAYGKPFVSDKQRRYVMASIREGRIDPGFPHRTGNTQRAYQIVTTNNGYTVKIENKTAGAYYTRDNYGQARLNLLAGWRKVKDVIKTNIDGAIRHAQSKVNEYLSRKAKQ